MTFLEIVQLLITTARQEPNINTVVREFTDLNREDIDYSAIVIQDRDGYRDYINNQDYITYSFYVGYVDMLSEEKDNSYDSRECDTYDNRDHIVSTGVTVINDMINVINNSYYPQLELRVSDRINTFHQRFTAECAGVYMVVNANVPISDCVDSDVKLFDTLQAVVTSNGDYHWTPSGDSVAYDKVDITVNVSGDKPEEGLVETISSNGSYHFDPSPGSVFSSADITVAVSGGGEKPEERLVQAISSNGSYHYDPEEGSVFSEADISVDVHPSVSLSETYTSNGTYSISGEYNGGAVTVAVPQKTEVICDRIINENGSFHYTPVSGEVFNDVHITADVHPSVSLSETYTSNGTYNISGEYNGGTVTVAVSAEKPEESLVQTISSNGSYHYDPSAGSVFSGADITVSVPFKPEVGIRDTVTSNGSYYFSAAYGEVLSYVDLTVSVPERKPEESLVETISSNGSYHYDPSEGSVFSGADITVDCPGPKEEQSLVEEISENGHFEWHPDPGKVFSDTEIFVDVHPTERFETTIRDNGYVRNYDDWNGVELFIDVHPSASLSETYTSNGTKTISGEFNGGTVNVDVHPSTSLSETYTSNGSYNVSGEFNGGVVTVAVPSDKKPEQVGSFEVTEWGSAETFYPDPGYVFSEVEITNNTRVKSYTSTVASNGRLRWSASEGEALVNSIDISVDVHPSSSLVQSISSNGVTTLSGEWKDAEITVDIHPSTSLSATYTSNGVYTEVGEWSGATIAVSVPERKPEETLVETISSNGSYHYDPSAGSVFSGADISVDVHPSVSLITTISSNGVTSLSGEWKDAEITVSVPAPVISSLSVNISSNGSYSYTAPAGEYYDSVAVDVSVPMTATLTITQADYNNLSVKDPDTIYLIYE